MHWKFVEVVNEALKTPKIYPPIADRRYMVNENGIEIALTGLEFNGGAAHFEYLDKQADLSIHFQCVGSGTENDGRLRDEDKNRVFKLGPLCRVTIFSNGISRQMTIPEGESVAATIRDFLLQLQNFPLFSSPYPECVDLSKIAKKNLGIPESAQ